MGDGFTTLEDLIGHARAYRPLRLAVVAADQGHVLESVREATSIGLIEPRLIGDVDAILACAEDVGLEIDRSTIIAANSEADSAQAGVDLVLQGEAEIVMKGHLHTDNFMRALLSSEHGLRVPGRRVSHAFMIDVPNYPKLITITDAAINISPDLNAKAQILENAIGLLQLLGVVTPRVAALSAVETVNPIIASTMDAACLALMARRGQIAGAIVDGPMAFDNAISAEAAREKGISSDVAGNVDILLVPDLVSGNILAKNLVYLAGGTAAGIVLGLKVPTVLSSRADPSDARLAALAIAALMHQPPSSQDQRDRAGEPESTIHCAAQPESASCPIGS